MHYRPIFFCLFQFGLLLLLAPTAIGQQMQTTSVAAPPYKTAPADLPRFDAALFDEAQLGDGYLFMGYFNYADFTQSITYMLILDNHGEPVFYRSLAPLGAILDFKRQAAHPDRISWFNPASNEQKFYLLDQAYETFGSFTTGNGFETDLHEMQLLPNGHALLMSYDLRLVDMSQLVTGGHPEAVVTGCTLQEVDENNEVVFQWQSWDHMSILDTDEDLTASHIDYVHCNSIEEDWDGNWLISSRNLSEVTKISRQTGEIIWRLGGKRNQFTFVNDDGFFFQHDARRQSNGNLTLYDNGPRRNDGSSYSRGVEYQLDEIAMTATLVWSYRNDPDTVGAFMGNMQRLPNGNSLIGWGSSSRPVLTEVTADGTKLLEMSSSGGNGSYRVFRYPWVGRPNSIPALVALSSDANAHLYFSWNGATEVVAYEVLAGSSPTALAAVATIPRTGFETEFIWSPGENGSTYFQVIPIMEDSSQGTRSDVTVGIVGGWTVYLPTIRSTP